MLTLEPSYREVLTLRFHEELSLEEIAVVTRAPLSTVKSRLYRGLASLKPRLQQLREQRNGEDHHHVHRSEVRK
jgi:RNA polymerase sigma-70 factor (ECF subfamily)